MPRTAEPGMRPRNPDTLPPVTSEIDDEEMSLKEGDLSPTGAENVTMDFMPAK